MDDLSFSLDDFDDLWDFEEFSSEGYTETATEGEPGQKQRRLEDSHHPVIRTQRPRILKSDFRRSFPQIWAGVFNFANYPTMINHLSTFYDRDASIMQQDLRLGAIALGLESNVHITGQTNIADFWYKAMTIAPDQVCTLKRTFVKLRSDGTSSITCTFALTGTEGLLVDESVQISEHAQHLPLITIGQEEAAPMQDVLQRYAKATDAVNRKKAHIKAAKLAKARAGGADLDRKRRKRSDDEPSPLPVVEEWLSVANEECPQSSGEHVPPLVCIGRYPSVTEAIRNFHTDGGFTLRSDNNHFIPQKAEYAFVPCAQGGILTAPLNLTCSVEMKFNVQCRVESVLVMYHD